MYSSAPKLNFMDMAKKIRIK